MPSFGDVNLRPNPSTVSQLRPHYWRTSSRTLDALQDARLARAHRVADVVLLQSQRRALRKPHGFGEPLHRARHVAGFLLDE